MYLPSCPPAQYLAEWSVCPPPSESFLCTMTDFLLMKFQPEKYKILPLPSLMTSCWSAHTAPNTWMAGTENTTGSSWPGQGGGDHRTEREKMLVLSITKHPAQSRFQGSINPDPQRSLQENQHDSDLSDFLLLWHFRWQQSRLLCADIGGEDHVGGAVICLL